MGSDYGLGLGLLMNYLSVCSGIEAATVAWHDMGCKPIGFSEIEKFNRNNYIQNPKYIVTANSFFF